jgi:hypothetical protein
VTSDAAAEGSAPAEEQPFPRGRALPSQSPLFWVAEKDRYLRQLLIRDIEALTGRRLIVYFADCDSPHSSAQIHPSDDAFLTELLRDGTGQGVDLLIETNGGYTDATEKLVAILRTLTLDLRVVVPRRAKSNGTLVALAAKSIVMGPGSELGPIDPNLILGPQNQAPAQFILQAPPEKIDPILRQAAEMAVAQTRKLATTLLGTGMLGDKSPAEIEDVVNKLATRDHFHSHGSVIDAREAKALGLEVEALSSGDPVWERFWLLRCLYSRDMRLQGLIKIFEGRFISNAFRGS